tara:strand:- start:36 stop:2462 length:2427 start_codon:yes stop_codon:yes gene_type:complete
MGGGIARARAVGGLLGNRSLRFNSGDSAYLNRTPSSAGNRKTYTLSFWAKSSNHADGASQGFSGGQIFSVGTTGAGARASIGFPGPAGGSNQDKFLVAHNASGSSWATLSSDAVFRDFSAWQHFVVAVDCTQSTASNRVKVYVNGSQITMSGTYPSNEDQVINNTVGHAIGRYNPEAKDYFNGYLTDIYFIDGSQLTPSSFGAADSNGVWQRSTYSGSYGTNGFHILDFANNGTIGNDTSGSGNNYTANNFSTTAGSGNDLLFDFPTNDTVNTDAGAGGEVTGNYATWDPLVIQRSGSVTLSNGNLDTTCGSTRTSVMSSFPLTGKTYWEVTFGNGTNNTVGMTEATGFNTLANDNSGLKYVGYKSYSYGWQQTEGILYNASNNLSSSPGAVSNGDVAGWAYDADNNTLKLYKNGVLQHTQTGIADAQYFPAITHADDGATASANFGQREFAYAAPSGYKALCTVSLPTPGVADGSDYFDQILYVGNQTSRSITGLSFSPDLVIVKNRDRGSYNHYWVDSVRGGQKNLYSNSNEEEHDADRITTLDSNGFTLSDHMGPNYNGENYVSHCWDAGSSTVSNSNGTITSQVRASQTAGFSIVSYTGNGTSGATIGHGLNKVPEFWLLKDRDSSDMWVGRHSGVPNTHYMEFNGTAQQRNAVSDVTGDADPTTSVIPVGSADSNNNGRALIAYIWAPIEGFSAAPSWTGNGNSDGVFIHLGFRPKAFWFKRTDSAANWYVYDSTRSTINPVNKNLEWNTGDAENVLTSMNVDFLSNGVKVRGNDGDINGSGGTYIGFAWAENPFQANGGIAR